MALFRVFKKIVKITAWTAGVLFIILYVAKLSWDSHYYKYYLASEKFDSHKWKTGKDSAGNQIRYKGGGLVKCKMYDDLTKNYLKIGMTIKEVEHLIGQTSSYSYCLDKKEKCATYVLGNCTLYGSLLKENESLEICYNNENNIIKFGREREVASEKKICNYKFAHCLKSHKKCDCYTMKNQSWADECTFDVNRW